MTTGICHISDPGHFSVLSHNRRPESYRLES